METAQVTATETEEQLNPADDSFWEEPEELETAEPEAGPSTAQGDEPSADASATQPATEAQTEASAAPAAQGTVQADQPKDIKPFSFRVDGEEFAPKGAVVTGGYVAIPVETFQRELQPRLRSRSASQREIDTLRREVEARDPEKHPTVAQANEIMRALDGLFEEQDEDKFWNRVAQVRATWPVTRAEAKARALEQQLNQKTSVLSEREQQERAREAEPVLRDGLSAHLDQVLASPQYKDLGLNKERLFNRLWQLGRQTFIEADRDYPEYGVAKGDTVLNLAFLQEFVEADAEIARSYLQRTQQQQAHAQAARQNAAALGQTDKKIPPAVSAKASAGSGKTQPTFKTKAEYDDYMRKIRKGEIEL